MKISFGIIFISFTYARTHTKFCLKLTHVSRLSLLSSADPKGGQGVRTPPGKSQVIWVSIGNKLLDPPPPLE